MTRIKICGITILEDGLMAAGQGADYLGFNFYPPSPRYITPDECLKITRQLSAIHPEVKLVGVFVNLPAAEVQAILDGCGLDLAQLHGDEPAEMLAALQGRAYKALRGTAGANLDAYLIGASGKPAALIDAAVSGSYGGTGATGDWEAARLVAARAPIFLAGGLNPENVAAAIQQVRPWGVDTASGVEQKSGRKDPARLQKFIEMVRLADQDIINIFR